MGGKSINSSSTRAEALTLQSSTYGATIAWLRGQHRVPGNLLWYGDFKATAHSQKQGGKGGGGASTSYSYEASVVMALGHGEVVAVPSVWKGKSRTTMQALGLSLVAGAVRQAVWPGLAAKGDQALGYSGLACIAVQAYQLGDTASLENHSFEVQHSSAYSVLSSTPDVDPAAATRDLLTDQLRGAGMDPQLIGDWTEWSDYCVASGLLVSPLLTTQVEAGDALQRMAELTNTAIVWSDGQLKMRPYGDAEIHANGRHFAPDTTPVYELNDTCYLVSGGDAPVRRSLKTPSDCFNVVSVEYKDRANAYNPAVQTARDLTDISANGQRVRDTLEAHWICDAEVARLVAELLKQRSLLVAGEYSVRLPMHYALLECMDLVTLTDEFLQLQGVPVRVKSIVEESDEELRIVCEDYPAGVANAPRYAAQVPAGFATDALVAPGSVAEALFFEAPAQLAAGGNGVEVWCAVRSAGPTWGGATLWVSLDGNNYRAMGRVESGARMGTLVEPVGESLRVHGMAGQLHSGSAEDAQAFTTLFAVLGSQPEYLAYETATLTGAGAYTLGGLVRGAYGSPVWAHQGGDPLVRIDEAVAKSGGLDASYIGRRIWFKLTSFNVYGAAEQSLADVEPFPYDVTGFFARRMPGVSGRGLALKASALAVAENAAGVRSPSAIELRAVLQGTLQGDVAWSIMSGDAELSGSGNAVTLDVQSIESATVRIRAALSDEIGEYADEVTIAIVKEGAKGADGDKGDKGDGGDKGDDGDKGDRGEAGTSYAQAVLYAWSPVQPDAPSGTSTYTWATAAHSSYTGGVAWQPTLPANPGIPGVRLWTASKAVAAPGGTVATVVSWANGYSIAAVGANGANGSSGLQVAVATIYRWDLTLPAAPVGQGQYAWANGALSGVPAGWSASPGAAPAPGHTLWGASIRVSDAAGVASSALDYGAVAISAVGYAGTAGQAGLDGASARLAYAVINGSSLAGAPASVQTSGNASFPPNGTWGGGEQWQQTVPGFGAGQSVMQINGVYDPASDKTTWGAPYLSSWKVGSLSAITANLGAITAGEISIGGGKFQVSSAGYLVARGAQFIDEATGQVVFSTKADAKASLPSSWVSPDGAWLNANVGINSSGQFYGGGAGTGVVVSNQQILVQGGKLTGVGTSDVAVDNTYARTGKNLLPNSDQQVLNWVYAYGPNGANMDGIGLSESRIPSGWTHNDYVLSAGQTHSAFFHQQGRHGNPSGDNDNINGNFISRDIYFAREEQSDSAVAVVGGQRVILSVYAVAHRCELKLFAAFLNASGGAIWYPSVQVPVASGHANKLSAFTRMSLAVDAPADAAKVALFVRKYDTFSGEGDSWVWLAAPMIELAEANATQPSTYSPGPASNPRQLGYTGDLNASAGIALINDAHVTISGSTLIKTAGGEGWDGGAHSRDSFSGGAYVSFVPAQVDRSLMVGLNGEGDVADPGYASIDYAFYCESSGQLYAYESGNSAQALGAYAAGDVLAVAYDGSNVRYFRNGAVLRTTVAAGLGRLFMDSAFAQRGGKVTNLQFGPMSSNAWAAIGGKPKSFIVRADGNAAVNRPWYAGLFNGDTGGRLTDRARSYFVVVLDRAGQVFFSQSYDVYGNGEGTSGRNAGTMAADLMGIATDPAFRNKVLVVYTGDEPQGNRLLPALLNAMLANGASREIYERRIRFHGAYCLVAVTGAGEGNGAEVYAGDVDSDPDAWCELAFQISPAGTLMVSGDTSGARSVQDFGYSGDMNATRGAPAGTPVAGSSADAVATAQHNYDTQVKEIYVPGNRETFYPVVVAPWSMGGTAASMEMTVCRPNVHANEGNLGSYACRIVARTSAWGHAPGAIVSLEQLTGHGTYTFGVGAVYASTGGTGLVIMMRGGMTHFVSVAAPIGPWTYTVYPDGYSDGTGFSAGPTSSAPLAAYLNSTYSPSTPYNQETWDVIMNGRSLIRAAHIQQLTSANFTVTTLSQVMNGNANSGARISMDLNTIALWRSNNSLSMRLRA